MTIYDHPEYLRFIEQIRERPDDDLPRLMCADWLREKGEDARADFIQCQIEKAELKCHPWCESSERAEALRQLEKGLHGANYSAHLHTLPLISHPTGYPDRIGIYSGDGYVQFYRGFVESIRIRGADWITHAEEILKRNPVRKVCLADGMITAGIWKLGTADRDFVNDLWPGVEFTFEREGPELHFGLASADQVDALPPGLYFGNESITVVD